MSSRCFLVEGTHLLVLPCKHRRVREASLWQTGRPGGPVLCLHLLSISPVLNLNQTDLQQGVHRVAGVERQGPAMGFSWSPGVSLASAREYRRRRIELGLAAMTMTASIPGELTVLRATIEKMISSLGQETRQLLFL